MKTRSKQSGRISFWDLFILVLIGVLAYLLYLRGHLDKYLPEQYASTVILGDRGQSQQLPAPAPAKLAPASGVQGTSLTAPTNTAPRSTSTAPKPSLFSTSPAAQAAPQPPATIDLATLDRRYWPRSVKLRRAMELPIIMNGKKVGSMQAPVGMELPVSEIRAREVVIKNGDGLQAIPAGDTDVLERVHGILKVVDSARGR